MNEQSTYVGSLQLMLAKKEDETVLTLCFLIHSVNEELEEVKDCIVFTVRLRQSMSFLVFTFGKQREIISELCSRLMMK